MANLTKPPKSPSSNIPRAFRKILLEQMKGRETLDDDELSLFEWYARESAKTIDLMLVEERAYIKEQVGAGLDLGDVNDSGMVAVEYYIKRARYGHVIYMASLLEVYLVRACDELKTVLGQHNVTFQPEELAGDKWTKRKKFLERFGQFEFPADAWLELQMLIRVRNVLVHENGNTDSISKSDKDELQDRPGVAIDRHELVIEDAYITHCLSAFRSLVEHINSQINQSIERTLQPQGLKPQR